MRHNGTASAGSEHDVLAALNRLYVIQTRSLPMYALDASPWTHPGDDKASQAVAHIVADQQAMALRLAELIDSRQGRVERGSFPMQFTDTNMLSLDYLLTEMVTCTRQDIETIRKCVERLAGDREALELAEEVLGSERAHLEALEALLKLPA